MYLEVDRVDHKGIVWAILSRQVAENPVENTHLRPAPEPITQRLLRTTLAWRIAPLKPVFEHINDARNHPLVISPWHPVRARKEWRNLRDLGRRKRQINPTWQLQLPA